MEESKITFSVSQKGLRPRLRMEHRSHYRPNIALPNFDCESERSQYVCIRSTRFSIAALFHADVVQKVVAGMVRRTNPASHHSRRPPTTTEPAEPSPTRNWFALRPHWLVSCCNHKPVPWPPGRHIRRDFTT